MKILSHPVEVLVKLYLGLSMITPAKRLNVPRTRLEQIVRGETSVIVDTALWPSKFFGNPPDFWMNL